MSRTRIKSFTSGCSYDGLVERQANEWISDNNIKVIDIRTKQSFFEGFKCEVIYKQKK